MSEGLSAPEAHVLINLPRWDVHRALKLGFMGLVTQGILRLDIEERPGFVRTRRVPHLRIAANLPERLPPVAASLVKMVRGAGPNGLLKDVLRECTREYRRTLVGFIHDCVGPALVARGLAEPERKRFLGLFPYSSFVLTPAGEAEKGRLQGLIHEAKAAPSLMDSDPVKAASLIAALGGAFLLVEELKPHYPALEKALRRADDNGGSGGDFSYVTSADALGGGPGAACFDFGHLDFSCFDAGAFDSFDAGFSDAGGGGDGGGGDGGGSSGC